MLKNFKLAPKFNLLLIIVFIGSILISGATLSSVLEQRAQYEVAYRARILIETMNSVRDYTSKRIIPLLAHRPETDPAFIPERVAAFSAKKVFENLRNKEEYKDFVYKAATLNPTNVEDQADSFETQVVNRFRNEPRIKELSGFRTLEAGKGKVFYIAQPLAIEQPSCLRCHSTPQAAPKSLLAAYGTEHGFGWKLNEIVTAQIISVPADEVVESAYRFWVLVMAILICLFAIVVIVINLLLKRAVIQPIRQMAKIAQAVSTGKANSDFEQNSNDEIGILAAAFNRMKSSLEIAMKLLEHKQN